MDLLKAAQENPVREKEGEIGWWGWDSGQNRTVGTDKIYSPHHICVTSEHRK